MEQLIPIVGGMLIVLAVSVVVAILHKTFKRS